MNMSGLAKTVEKPEGYADAEIGYTDTKMGYADTEIGYTDAKDRCPKLYHKFLNFVRKYKNCKSASTEEYEKSTTQIYKSSSNNDLSSTGIRKKNESSDQNYPVLSKETSSPFERSLHSLYFDPHTSSYTYKVHCETVSPESTSQDTSAEKYRPKPTYLHSQPPSSRYLSKRASKLSDNSYQVHILSQNIDYMVTKSKNETSELKKPEEILVLHFTFMTAKARHIRKYASLFTVLGCDVLVVRIGTRQISSTSMAQAIAVDVCKVLKDIIADYDKILVFGCSVGGYMFCETMFELEKDPTLERCFHSMVVAQIWECCVLVNGIAIGLASTATDNNLAQQLISTLVKIYLKLKYKTLTSHLLNIQEYIESCPLRVPTYHMYSDADPMSTAAANEAIAKKWRNKNVSVTRRVFRSTPHMQNMLLHPVEYREGVYSFLSEVGLTSRGTTGG